MVQKLNRDDFDDWNDWEDEDNGNDFPDHFHSIFEDILILLSPFYS